MAAVLDLNNRRSRRLGMTKNGYQFAESLHASRPQTKREVQATTLDIFAPPQDSSDEASIEAEEDAHSKSPESTADLHRRSRSPNGHVPGKSDGSVSPLGRGELSCDPSTIPATEFVSQQTKSSNGSQNSQKRSKIIIDEDDEDMAFVKPAKKCRTSYGGSSQRSTQDNIHHSSTKRRNQKPAKKSKVSENGDGKTSIRLLRDTEETMARGLWHLSSRAFHALTETQRTSCARQKQLNTKSHLQPKSAHRESNSELHHHRIAKFHLKTLRSLHSRFPNIRLQNKLRIEDFERPQSHLTTQICHQIRNQTGS